MYEIEICKCDMQIRCEPIGAHLRPTGRFPLRQSVEEQNAAAGAATAAAAAAAAAGQCPIRSQQRQSRDLHRPIRHLRQ